MNLFSLKRSYPVLIVLKTSVLRFNSNFLGLGVGNPQYFGPWGPLVVPTDLNPKTMVLPLSYKVSCFYPKVQGEGLFCPLTSGLHRMRPPNCLVRVHKKDSFPWFHFECKAGDQLQATIWHLSGGERGRRRSDAAFFKNTFFSERKILGPTGLDPRSDHAGDRKSNTLTTIPNSPVVRDGSGDAHTRESQIVFSSARWQRDRPLSLDNTFETDKTDFTWQVIKQK